MAEFGEKFKQQRMKLGYSLEDVEEETKIRKYYLSSIENEQFSNLPPKVYAVGFVKRYAKILNLDPEIAAEEFKKIAYNDIPSEELLINVKQPVENNKESSPPYIISNLNIKNILAGLVFLIFAIWAGNIVLGYIMDRGMVEQPGQPPQIVDPQPEPSPSEEQDVSETQPENVNLLIEARQNCWLLVIVDGEEKFTGILAAGNELSFEGDEEIFLRAGNAGGIDLTLNGNRLDPIGESWSVEEMRFTKNEGE